MHDKSKLIGVIDEGTKTARFVVSSIWFSTKLISNKIADSGEYKRNWWYFLFGRQSEN